jgi:CheY-like chemotaxis protein
MTMKSSRGPKRDAIALLLADDYDETRTAYADAAIEAGFTVETAADGVQALALALLVVPDVIVTEALLGGLDGFELARRMKRNPRTEAIPVVILTGLVLPDLSSKAEASGCVALLTKPCTFEALEQTIRRVVREHRGIAQPA